MSDFEELFKSLIKARTSVVDEMKKRKNRRKERVIEEFEI
jgi:hypothetical protein